MHALKLIEKSDFCVTVFPAGGQPTLDAATAKAYYISDRFNPINLAPFGRLFLLNAGSKTMRFQIATESFTVTSSKWAMDV